MAKKPEKKAKKKDKNKTPKRTVVDLMAAISKRLDEADDDATRFDEGVKGKSTPVRKILKEVMDMCKDLRKEIQERRNNM